MYGVGLNAGIAADGRLFIGKLEADAARVPAPIQNVELALEATPTGGAQSKDNSEAAHQHARAQHDKTKGKAVSHGRGNAVGLNEATPPGQSGQTGPPAHSNAGGNGGGSSGGNSSSRVPKTTLAPKGAAKGHTKVPSGHSK